MTAVGWVGNRAQQMRDVDHMGKVTYVHFGGTGMLARGVEVARDVGMGQNSWYPSMEPLPR